MDEASTGEKGKARKIPVQVEEQPAPSPIAPPRLDRKQVKKKIWYSYVYMIIGAALVVASSVDLYTPSARGQAALGLLIVGGLWLAYGVYTYLRFKE
jgi:hypothetical protein